MVNRTLALFTAAKRVPLIKFRKGGNAIAGTSNQASSRSPAAAGATPVKGAAGSSTAIEDWELPPRYARKPIDPLEMEYINRGGPA